MTSAPPKFVVNTLDESTIEKIELSLAASEDMEFREIHCPYCSIRLIHPSAFTYLGFVARIEVKTR